MQNNKEHITHADSLRTDILGAPDVWLPRRDVILDWLNGFLRRAAVPSYALGDTEADDLTALDRFLRKRKIPVA
jgi:hypothetical protein